LKGGPLNGHWREVHDKHHRIDPENVPEEPDEVDETIDDNDKGDSDDSDEEDNTF
jgi:hypothetical protein